MNVFVILQYEQFKVVVELKPHVHEIKSSHLILHKNISKVTVIFDKSFIPKLQQIWLDQNITQKLASAHESNIFYRIFEQTTVGKTSFSVSPAQFHDKVSKRFTVTFTLNFSLLKHKTVVHSKL
jgi:hypothetical protein